MGCKCECVTHLDGLDIPLFCGVLRYDRPTCRRLEWMNAKHRPPWHVCNRFFAAETMNIIYMNETKPFFCCFVLLSTRSLALTHSFSSFLSIILLPHGNLLLPRDIHSHTGVNRMELSKRYECHVTMLRFKVLVRDADSWRWVEKSQKMNAFNAMFDLI